MSESFRKICLHDFSDGKQNVPVAATRPSKCHKRQTLRKFETRM
jgi:hypothetical protein